MDADNKAIRMEGILGQLQPEEQSFLLALIDKDPLTGVYNRRKFDRDLELVLAMSDRTQKGISLFMIDIDHFKKYNDQFGHQEGDRILREVTRCLETSLREYDKTHIYRYGGEEFVIIIPQISDDNAYGIGERLRKQVKTATGVSISVGISHYRAETDDLQTLIENADKALYLAKEKGRDRVEVHDKGR